MPTLLRDQIRSGDVLVQGCEDRAVGAREVAQVAVADLLGGSDPSRKMRDVVIVRNKLEPQNTRPLETQQQGSSLGNGKSVGRCLGQNAYESQFDEGACGKA